MPSYEYTVEINEPNTNAPHRPRAWNEIVRTVDGQIVPWAAPSAIGYCRTAGHAEGTQMRITRSTVGGSDTMPYRTYEVGDGIVRRTDR